MWPVFLLVGSVWSRGQGGEQALRQQGLGVHKAVHRAGVGGGAVKSRTSSRRLCAEAEQWLFANLGGHIYFHSWCSWMKAQGLSVRCGRGSCTGNGLGGGCARLKVMS